MTEGFNSFQENLAHPEISERDLRQIYALMQLELATEDLGFEPDDVAFGNWIEKHSADFAHVATQSPELVLKYQSGGQEGRDALKETHRLMNETFKEHEARA